MERAGYRVARFATAQSFIALCGDTPADCLLIALDLPGASAIKVIATLPARSAPTTFVVTATSPDIASAVHAMKLGALDVLEKPIASDRLLASVADAAKTATRRKQHLATAQQIESKILDLTSREKQVMRRVASGMTTKQIAESLQISEKTVEVHRSNMTKKMKLGSVAQLVRMIVKYAPSQCLSNAGNGVEPIPLNPDVAPRGLQKIAQ